MKPQDLIRAAAKILDTVGWTHGVDQKGQAVHCRNVKGDPIPLFRGDNSGADKARVNPDAVAFSIYGALTKAIDDARGKVASTGLMWQTLQQVAIAHGGVPRPGGTNFVHPLLQVNELPGQTLDGVLAYLELAAATIEQSPDPDAAAPSKASQALAQMNSFAAAGVDTGLPAVTIPKPQAIEAPLMNADDIVFIVGGPFAPPTPEQMANSITIEAGETIKVEGDGVIQRIKDEPKAIEPASPVAIDHDDDLPPLGDE